MDSIYKAGKRSWGNPGVWLAGCLIVLHTHNVSAQEQERLFTVAERFARVYQPDGVPVGAMRLFPKVGLGGLSSDNVFANDDFEESDWAVLANAEAVLQSNTSRYFAEFGARAEFTRFDDFDENDSDNGRLWINGATDITSTNSVEGTLSYDALTEPRTSANIAPGSTELTEYSVSTVSGIYNYQPSRWGLRLDGRYRDFEFDDVDTLAGRVDNSDRDRKVLDFGARVSYDVADNYGLFVEGRIDDADYDQTVDNDGFERSFDGYELRLGTELKLSGVVVGEFFVGYLSRDFDDPSFDTSDGASYGAAIDWVITELMTFKINGSRTTEPTTVVGASTILDSRASLGVDYELRRNLVLSTEFEFVNDDFEGISREDDNKIFRLGAEYRMNRNIWLEAGYRYWDRDSSSRFPDPDGREFTINEFIIQLTYQI